MIKKTVFVLVFLLTISCGLDAAQKKTAKNKKQEEPQEGYGEQKMEDFSLSGFDRKGKKAWEVKGNSADIFTDIVKLTSVIADVYGEEENIKLTGDKGAYDKASGKMHLEDNVVITTSSGGKLTTDSLDWDRESQRVTTEDMVDIRKQNIKAVAKGLEGQPNLKEVSLKDKVTVEIEEQKDPAQPTDPLFSAKEPTVITCDGPLVINYEKEIATFNNNVKVDQKEQGVMHADKMEVYFDFKNKKILRIKSTGNVKILKDDNVSYSDEAEYRAEDKKMTLSGRPRLVINSEDKVFNASSGN